MTTAWAMEIEHYCAWLAASASSPGTVRLRRHYLRHLAADHPGGPWTPRLDDLVAFVARPGWAPQTRKAARGSVRGFYRWAALSDRVTADPARLLPAVRIPMTRPRPAPTPVLAAAMLAAGPREQVMLLLEALAGLRRAEVAALRIRDVLADHLHVKGKGGRERTIPLHPTLRRELVRHLDGRTDGPVFDGQIDGHLSPNHVGKLVSELLGPGWTGHKLRVRFATRSYAVERDLLAVQRLLGHSKPETTALYVEPPGDAMRNAVMAA